MSNSTIKDDKSMGNADKDQRDRDQKSNVGGQRQQSTAPGSQQGGKGDDRNQQSGHQQSGGHHQADDQNRKPGKRSDSTSILGAGNVSCRYSSLHRVFHLPCRLLAMHSLEDAVAAYSCEHPSDLYDVRINLF